MTNLEKIREIISRKQETAVTIAQNVWEYAELSYNETKSAKSFTDALKEEGFTVEEGIADIPTAFKASFKIGTGKPVIGLLAEYDALEGLSQKAACTQKEAIIPQGNGHGCGHNLLGAGSYLSAVTLKEFLTENGLNGTVVLFGCPAEEGAGSKQFIARAGCFDDVDFVYTWHPGDSNGVQSESDAAIMGASFSFQGITSNPGSNPHLGRSALDACELMNVGVNYLREHMISSARIHYAYADAGGTAPNVIPDHATIKYEIRAPKVEQARELFTRVTDIAKGAALMTGTTMTYELKMAFSDYVPNKALSQRLEQAIEECGAPVWNEEDYELAKALLRSYDKDSYRNILDRLSIRYPDEEVLKRMLEKPLDDIITPYNINDTTYNTGSTDVGDVGYVVPTSQFHMSTGCIGNIMHTWQNTAFSNSPIGMKGMIKAAEVMAYASILTMDDEELIEKAKKEVLKKNGGKYECPLPDYVTPPIDNY